MIAEIIVDAKEMGLLDEYGIDNTPESHEHWRKHNDAFNAKLAAYRENLEFILSAIETDIWYGPEEGRRIGNQAAAWLRGEIGELSD